MKLRDGIELRSLETSDALRARLRGSGSFRRSAKEMKMKEFGLLAAVVVLLNFCVWGGLIYFVFWCAKHFGLIG